MWYLLFLCIVSITAESYHEGSIYRTSTRNDGEPRIGFYGQFFPLRSNVINFRVQSAKDAYVCLTTGPHDTNPIFEVLIGSYRNRYLYIRKNRNLSLDEYVYNYGILNEKQYRGFWITLDYWDDADNIDSDGWNRMRSWLEIKVGLEGEVVPLITRKEKNPLNINFYGISSWSVAALWELNEPFSLIPQARTISLETKMSYEPTYTKFFKVARNKIKFRYNAAYNVYVALTTSETANRNTGVNDFVEIRLSLSNEKHVITNVFTKDKGEFDTGTFLQRDYGGYREVWFDLVSNYSDQVTADIIRIGFEGKNDVYFTWKNPSPTPINYFSPMSTGGPGYFMLEETHEPPNHEGYKYVETDTLPDMDYQQFFTVDVNTIRVQVRARQAAVVGLGLYYQILFGADNVDDLTIRRLNFTSSIDLGKVTLPKTLDESLYRRFWIKFTLHKDPLEGTIVRIIVGYEFESIPLLDVSNPDDGYEIKYYSVATRRGPGFWILEDPTVADKDRTIEEKIVWKSKAPFKDSFKFIPVHSNVINFKVMANERNRADIALSRDAAFVDDNVLITLGKHLVVLNQYHNAIGKGEVEHTHINRRTLNSSHYRSFWIKFNNYTLPNKKQSQLIRVGHKGDVYPFLAWTDDNPYPINCIGLSPNSWVVERKAKEPRHIHYDDDVYTIGDGVIQYFRATTECLKFKVHAKSDAIIVFSPTKESLPPYFKITLSKDGGSDNTIDKNGVVKFRKKNSLLLHKNDFREFWVQWDYLSYAKMIFNFGRAGETKPMMHWVEEEAFLIDFVGFTTINHINGTWSIPYFDETKMIKEIVS